MKKKIVVSILTGLCACLMSAAFSACGGGAKHTHEYLETARKEATCTEAGLITYTCECEDFYTEEIPALGHDEETHEAKVPTCTEIGWEEYVTCEREGCDYSTYNEIPATGVHILDEGKETTPPTCTKAGVTTYTCTVCKTAIYTESIDALAHDIEVHNSQAPTCTEMGWDAYADCARDGCDYSTYKEIPALGHDKVRNIAKAPTCTEIGWEEYVTCEREGCEYSTYKELPATGVHTWDEGKETKAPTCTSEGEKTYTCTVCKTASYTEIIPALGHDEKTHEAQAPTCTEIGWEEYVTCEREGCDYSTYNEISATGHDYIYHEAQAVTCLEIGWDAYKSCSRCDYTECEEISMQHNAEGNNGRCLGCGLPESSAGLKYFQNGDGTYKVYGCNSSTLTDVVIGFYNGKDVTSIDGFAFYSSSSLTSVVIGDSVTSIGGLAFAYCSSLRSVEIGDSVTSIGDSAFRDCSSLKSVEIGNGVTSIGDSVFRNCSSLTEMTIPFVGKTKDATGYQAVFGYIFGYTTSSSSSTINGAIYQYSSEDTYYHYYIPTSLKQVAVTGEKISSSAFRNCSSLTSVVIGDSVTLIGSSAFWNCRSLTSVEIPDSVTSIGNGAFEDCYRLTNIEIPDSVTSIGDGAFGYCSSLTSITIPDSVTSIGSYAFYDCNGLRNVVIGDSVTSIDEGAFYDCDKLVEVVNKSTHITVTKGSSSNGYVGYYALAVYNSDSGITESQLTNDNGYIIYTDGADKILVGYNGMETDLVLPSYITEIYKYAFYNGNRLTSVVIGDSVTSIGSYAFRNCSSLKSVVIGDSVTSIGSSAFYSCDSLTSITFKDTSTWYRTTSSSNSGGTSTSVTNSSTNATYFKETYCSYYWYKL